LAAKSDIEPAYDYAGFFTDRACRLQLHVVGGVIYSEKTIKIKN